MLQHCWRSVTRNKQSTTTTDRNSESSSLPCNAASVKESNRHYAGISDGPWLDSLSGIHRFRSRTSGGTITIRSDSKITAARKDDRTSALFFTTDRESCIGPSLLTLTHGDHGRFTHRVLTPEQRSPTFQGDAMRNLTESSPYRYRRGTRSSAASRGGRSYVGVTLALTGVAVLGAIGVQALNRNSQSGRRSGIARSASPRSPEVERSLTVEKSPEELYPLWSDPQNFQRIIGHFARVEMIDERRARWSAPPPLGQWIMRLVDNRANEFMRWEPEDSSAPLQESTIRFIQARGFRNIARARPYGSTQKSIGTFE